MSDWLAYYQLEPFGDEWRQTARLCSLVANALRGKSQWAYKEEDFMPTRPAPPPPPEQSAEEQLAAWRAIAAIQNARK